MEFDTEQVRSSDLKKYNSAECDLENSFANHIENFNSKKPNLRRKSITLPDGDKLTGPLNRGLHAKSQHDQDAASTVSEHNSEDYTHTNNNAMTSNNYRMQQSLHSYQNPDENLIQILLKTIH